MKNGYSPAGQDTIGYYDAISAIENLKDQELKNYRKYMELNPADKERRYDHMLIMSAYSAAADALHELRRGNA